VDRDRRIVEGRIHHCAHIVATGWGSVAPAGGGRLHFVFRDFFSFAGDLIGHLRSYQVNFSGGA
jgi:hypothetical protein